MKNSYKVETNSNTESFSKNIIFIVLITQIKCNILFSTTIHLMTNMLQIVMTLPKC